MKLTAQNLIITGIWGSIRNLWIILKNVDSTFLKNRNHGERGEHREGFPKKDKRIWIATIALLRVL